MIAIWVFLSTPCYGQGKKPTCLSKDKETKTHFYDLNKNGRMDTYENPTATIAARVDDLLSQMTLEEKVGQMLTSLGWQMYERTGDNIRLTEN